MIGITNEYLASVQPRNKSIGEMVMVAYYKFDPVSGRLLKSTGEGNGVVGGIMAQETFVDVVNMAAWSHFSVSDIVRWRNTGHDDQNGSTLCNTLNSPGSTAPNSLA